MSPPRISTAFNFHQQLPLNTNRTCRGSSMATQNGTTLIISLVILITITFSAVTAMQRSTLQVRMVGNMQHQQNVFNTAQNDLSSLIDQLRNSDNADNLLNKAIQAERQATGSTIDPFGLGGLVKPSAPQNIKPSTNKLRAVSLPADIPQALKTIEGSSASTVAPYHFANKTEVMDTNNGLKSTQEVGFYYLAPAPYL